MFVTVTDSSLKCVVCIIHVLWYCAMHGKGGSACVCISLHIHSIGPIKGHVYGYTLANTTQTHTCTLLMYNHCVVNESTTVISVYA